MKGLIVEEHFLLSDEFGGTDVALSWATRLSCATTTPGSDERVTGWNDTEVAPPPWPFSLSIFHHFERTASLSMESSQRVFAGQHSGDNYTGPIASQSGIAIVGGHGNTNIVFSQEADKLLQSLPGWDLDRVRFNESKACLPKTRQQLLHDIQAWVQSPNRNRILWLSGGAGTGKSSVAHSCAMLFDNSGHLGGTFFFNRDIATLNSPEYLVTNLCYQLAHFDPQLKQRILSAIQSMGHIPASSLRTQARKLIVKTTSEANIARSVVLVVDAVDEAGTQDMREPLLEAIVEEFSNLPDSIKVIITSRDEYDIRTALEECSDEMCVEKAQKTEEDIASYMRHRFSKIRKRARLPRDWPDPEVFQALCLRAGRLFVWASVACNFVDDDHDHIRRLDELLDLTNNQKESARLPLSTLNILYSRILETGFDIQETRPAYFDYVLGSIVVLETPLSCVELDSLLGIGTHTAKEGLVLPDGRSIHIASSGVIVNSIRSILREDTSDHGQTDIPIRLLHPSLYDFLTSYADDHLRIDVIERHHTLAIRCLQVMNSQLKFDICKIGDVSLPNPDISETSQHISGGLRYACLSFVYHLTKVSDLNPVLTRALKEFVCEHILHWIEAMSLLQAITKAEECLRDVATWLKDRPGVDELIEMIVCDAIGLLRNCGQGVRLSALHTYYSALPVTPKSRKLFQHYFSKFPGVPDIVCSHPTWPATSVRILEGHTLWVNHVVFSPDGKKLASAASDNTLRLWDVDSGQSIGDALRGHTNSVKQVVFSPDGKKLASASYDKTLRLWDVDSGKPIGDALEHTEWVHHIVFSPDGKKLASASAHLLHLWDVDSVQPIGKALRGHASWIIHMVFSPDGKKIASASSWNRSRIFGRFLDRAMGALGHAIASASYDNTLLLWDLDSGQSVRELRGHTSWVNHVVFSPDGKKLVSASDDNTLRLWDVDSGQPIGNALKGHTEWVNQVVFSPEGKKLASASDDSTLRLWDVDSGRLIGDALRGHTWAVNHVLFSPDGKQLASASEDSTLRLWDVDSGQPIGDALKGHTRAVNHVEFSPDGKKLASASSENALRLWDVDSHQSIEDALRGHITCVTHVVFSPDGKKLASASEDNTLRFWDAESGRPIGDALTGHTNSVQHIVFSPDGKKLASASNDNTLRLWDVESVQPIGDALRGHTSWVNHVVFSPDGKKLASAASENTLRLWDVDSGQPIGNACTSHTWLAYRVIFSPDGKKLASVAHDNTLRLWDVDSGQPIGDALKGHTQVVNHVVFSPDGKKLASASSDHTLRLWDVDSGQPIGDALSGHTNSVMHVAFSPDGKKIASTSYDAAVRFWDVESCQSLDGTDAGSTFNDYYVSIDSQGYLRHLSRRLLWLPVPLRGRAALSSSSVAIGSPSGAVTFIRWPTSFSCIGVRE